MFKYFKVAHLCSVLIFTLNVYANVGVVDKCHEQFQPLTVSEIQNIFSDKDNYKKYKGQTGYLLFAQKSPNIDNMEDLFALAFKALGSRFRDLSWRQHQGTPEQMQKERDRILDGKGQPKAEYIGLKGYIKYTVDYHEGDMNKAFQEVLEVLDRAAFSKFGWDRYHGTLEQMQKERAKILDEEDKPKTEYLGMDGCIRYATDHYKGNMYQAFKNVVVVLGGTVINKELRWKRYYGTTEEFQKERSQVLEEHGQPKKEYIGMDGYIRYTEDYYKAEKKIGDEVYYYGNMGKAFENVLTVLGWAGIKELGWRRYHGSSEQMKREREQILDKDGELKAEYIGMEGCIRYATDHYEEDMQQAYSRVSDTLEKTKSKKLKWIFYKGTTEEFQEEREQILDKNGQLKAEYIGLDGYSKYTIMYYKERPKIAYENVRAVLGPAVFEGLGWRQYHSPLEQIQKARDQLLDEDGEPKEEYIGLKGCGRYAKDYYEGSMQKAFEDVKRTLLPDEFEKLRWRMYQGFSEDLQRERERILDEDGEPRSEYLGMDGYAKYAADYYEGGMQKAYENVKAVLTQYEFKKLLWKLFLGTPADLQTERTWILDEYHYPKDEYFGMDGFCEYATTYHKGNMGKSGQNVAAIFGGYKKMEALGLNWKRFDGSVSEYKNILELFKQADIREFEGCEGLKEVADKIFRENRKRTYENVFNLAEMLLGRKDAFRYLNWSESCF